MVTGQNFTGTIEEILRSIFQSLSHSSKRLSILMINLGSNGEIENGPLYLHFSSPFHFSSISPFIIGQVSSFQ
ncbi:hypothetical protein J1TS3_17170 [Siminovitchia fordii]|uniref:Uncharacterized protein n=1 Tax=Siminovitchia fordii TaxID=254759 RepID=A0ABQ4K5Z6_9BACI|nr:hypothetical protein J1TS3_17170 [Siminovitchia fordii]